MTHAPTTIFQARKIITMNPMQPEATHVAVRTGRILGVGTAEELQGWGAATLDTRFADKVLMPGLVEGHAHLLEGGMWNFVYAGFHDRRGPDGRLWPGLQSFDALIVRLREAQAELTDPDQPLFAWGFDPIHFGTARMTVQELDQVSTTRPVVVLHASVHLMNVNSAMLQLAGIDADNPTEGIAKDPQGQPTGELQEMAAMFPVFATVGNVYFEAGQSEAGIYNFGLLAQLAGVTTSADLSNNLAEDAIASLVKATSDPQFPLRLAPAYSPMRDLDRRGPDCVRQAMLHNSDKLHFGQIKMVIDGSIQGFTARLRWPHYYNGAANGLWVISPQQTRELIDQYHRAGFTIHMHTNGDEATDLVLDTVEAVLRDAPRWDHRHTLQHCQLADANQFKRMATLGMSVNLFANHLYYWGDAHYSVTVGPDRANRMNAAGTALRYGVPFSLHSDAPITPIAPLFTAWCAVNRQTASGRVLGAHERIPVYDALHAVTLGAAHTLRLDHCIGSIEIGKFADFAVLHQDPLEVPPEALRDVQVWGTVLGGQVFEAPAQP